MDYLTTSWRADEVGDIYKIVSYFACQASGWKDSFFQTEYILEEVLGKDGSHRKKDVTSILNLISDAHLITKGHKSKKRLRGWILSGEVGIKSILDNA